MLGRSSSRCSSRRAGHGVEVFDADRRAGRPRRPSGARRACGGAGGRSAWSSASGAGTDRPAGVRVNAQAIARRRTAGSPARWPRSATSPPSDGRPMRCAGRSSSCRCCSTPSTRASSPATPRGGSPSSTRPPGGSTDWTRTSSRSAAFPIDRGLRRPDGIADGPRENPLIRAMSGEQLHDVEILLAPREGEQRKVSVNGQALVDEDGWKLGAVVAMHDVTEQKRNEERLAELALHDPLTGLANRTLLAERLQEAVDACARATDRRRAALGRRRVTGSVRAAGWPSTCSTSTSSRRSTTCSATMSATTCWSPSPADCWPSCARGHGGPPGG